MTTCAKPFQPDLVFEQKISEGTLRAYAEVDRRVSLAREVEIRIDVNSHRSARLRQTILAEAFFRKAASGWWIP